MSASYIYIYIYIIDKWLMRPQKHKSHLYERFEWIAKKLVNYKISIFMIMILI